MLAFHSFVAKPFSSSESMMPGLLQGDRWGQQISLRLVVVSPSFHFPADLGGIWGSLPERGDIVIATRRAHSDYITGDRTPRHDR